ncbi:MAG TPA: hypothetical protein DCO79_15275 [Spirochaeta sp.]|nr:hypothetical protein [Spirochaeta sp.]
MNKPSVKHLIIVCSLILFCLIIILAVQLRNESRLQAYYSILVGIDSDIDSKSFPAASSALKSAYNKIYNARTAVMFLKRAEKLASESGRYEILQEYSMMLKEKYRRSDEISAIAAWALQKEGDYHGSLEISQSDLSRTDYYPIHILNLLNSEAGSSPQKLRKKYIGYYGFLFREHDFTTDELLIAAEDFSDERFILNAALMNLREGNFETAGVLLSRTGIDSFPQVKAYYAFDDHNFKQALNYFQKNKAEISDYGYYLFGCDLLIKNALTLEAADYYGQFVEKYPVFSSLPYRNLYSINYNYDLRLDWLDKGLKYFPEDNELLVSSIWEMYKNKDYDSIADTIDNIDDSDTSIELFKLNLMLSGRNPEHIIANFWNAYNAAPDSENAAVSFANYLLKNKQAEQLELLLKRYADAAGADDWTFCYSAVSHAMQGKYRAAEALIEHALEVNKNIPNYYNKAVIFSLMNKREEALRILEKTVILAEETKGNDRYLPKIYYSFAENYYNVGDYINADIYIRKLLKDKSYAMKSKLLLKKIQEEYND